MLVFIVEIICFEYVITILVNSSKPNVYSDHKYQIVFFFFFAQIKWNIYLRRVNDV